MDQDEIRDTEIALMDAIKTVLEVMIGQEIASPVYLDKAFAGQRDAFLQRKMGSAAGVMELLRRFVTDPERGKRREQYRILSTELPKGSA